MEQIKSQDYHDYVIKEGRFIGAFEEMYRNVEDPWRHGDAKAPPYDLMLYLLKKYEICSQGGTIFDVGCGKGAFTARMRAEMPLAKITAVDIAPTAIQKARARYGSLGIEFEVLDIQKEYQTISQKFDLIIMSQLMWYILPRFQEITDHLLGKNLKESGYLLVSQAFLKPEEQRYGKEIVQMLEDMVRLIPLEPLETLELNRFTNHNAVILFRNIKRSV